MCSKPRAYVRGRLEKYRTHGSAFLPDDKKMRRFLPAFPSLRETHSRDSLMIRLHHRSRRAHGDRRRFGHHDPGDDVGQHSRPTAADCQDQPHDTDDGDVQVKVLRKSGANARDFSVRTPLGRPNQLLRLRCHITHLPAAVGAVQGVVLNLFTAKVAVHGASPSEDTKSLEKGSRLRKSFCLTHVPVTMHQLPVTPTESSTPASYTVAPVRLTAYPSWPRSPPCTFPA